MTDVKILFRDGIGADTVKALAPAWKQLGEAFASISRWVETSATSTARRRKAPAKKYGVQGFPLLQVLLRERTARSVIPTKAAVTSMLWTLRERVFLARRAAPTTSTCAMKNKPS